jgi:hypothetical protein
MTDLILGPVLRHVSGRSATIWMETDGPCSVRCCDTTSSTFHVRGHHYALVIVEGLEPGSTTPYEVHLDGERRWPPDDSDLPPSSIRTLPPDGEARTTPLRILFGSCRTAAPHEPPWSLELANDDRGRGVDALYAHARWMAERPVDEWAELVVFLGDQVYADDSSPKARERIAARRKERPAHERLPPELVDDFEEYTWLYHESWSPPWERWLLSVVPSVMIFDDHEIIDDWNISDTWVTDIRKEDWWHDHIVGGLATYWLYQHLGNLSPQRIEEEGMLAALLAADDGYDFLTHWAEGSEEFTPVPGGYRFSFARDIGGTKLVMVDSRNGRVLEPGKRAMVDDDEWAWVEAECRAEVDHLIIGTSLPAFAPGAVHDAQEWNEAVIDGARARQGRRVRQRVAEQLRRWIDMEDWAAFGRSFDRLVDLITEIGSVDRDAAPASIIVLSGDIHFSYHSELHFPPARRVGSRCHQVVNSPIRNALTGKERLLMRTAISRPAALLGRALRRLAGRERTDLRWRMDHGPVWANSIGELRITGRRAEVKLEQASPADEQGTPQLDAVFVVDLA